VHSQSRISCERPIANGMNTEGAEKAEGAEQRTDTLRFLRFLRSLRCSVFTRFARLCPRENARSIDRSGMSHLAGLASWSMEGGRGSGIPLSPSRMDLAQTLRNANVFPA